MPYPEPEPDIVLTRENIILATGFCIGLANSGRFPFDPLERKLILTAGYTLELMLERLYKDEFTARYAHAKNVELPHYERSLCPIHASQRSSG
jgi:hypothetical protein